eukprot:scaffold82688_cov63-Phaeocystis_antarctica.AAC.1
MSSQWTPLTPPPSQTARRARMAWGRQRRATGATEACAKVDGSGAMKVLSTARAMAARPCAGAYASAAPPPPRYPLPAGPDAVKLACWLKRLLQNAQRPKRLRGCTAQTERFKALLLSPVVYARARAPRAVGVASAAAARRQVWPRCCTTLAATSRFHAASTWRGWCGLSCARELRLGLGLELGLGLVTRGARTSLAPASAAVDSHVLSSGGQPFHLTRNLRFPPRTAFSAVMRSTSYSSSLMLPSWQLSTWPSSRQQSPFLHWPMKQRIVVKMLTSTFVTDQYQSTVRGGGCQLRGSVQ